MTDKILYKNQLSTFVEDLIKKYIVFAPTKKDDFYRFARISSSREFRVEFQNSKLPPKEVFLPQTEVLFTFTRSEKGIEIDQPSPLNGEVVVFGVRPCDARGLVLFDRFLTSGEQRDTYYLEKRGKSIVVGMACNQPRNTCFCTSLGGGPFSKEGMDLLLVDVGDKYLVEVVSQRGARLIEKLPYLKDVENVDKEAAEKLSKKAEEAVATKVPVEGLTHKLDGMFDSPFWDSLYQKCVGCGVCTYLCPTCWCFDILDEETQIGGRRIRIWDSCQYPLFTKQASGFNPRPSGKERMRQRIMHKFNYFPKEFGEFACVGCGRCVQSCPVNLDIREVINSIMSG